MSLFSNLGEGC